jgi:YggT family protein
MIEIVSRIVYSVLTLYMMLILLRWFSPWLELNLHRAWFSWIPKVTDPLIQRIRGALPPMGPLDFGPIAALVVVLLIRTVAMSLLASRGV